MTVLHDLRTRSGGRARRAARYSRTFFEAQMWRILPDPGSLLSGAMALESYGDRRKTLVREEGMHPISEGHPLIQQFARVTQQLVILSGPILSLLFLEP